jgi:hypothetical protein
MATMEDAINAHIAWMKKWTGIGIEPVDTVCHEYCNSKECRNLDKDPAGHAPRYQGIERLLERKNLVHRQKEKIDDRSGCTLR